jgi:hypothetical protein
MIRLSKKVPCTSLFSDPWVHHISEPESFFPVEQYKQISGNVHNLYCTTIFETGHLLQQKKHEDTTLLSLKHESAIYN